jgi:phosphatidyl-myo-inositol dimannoside synthase
VKSLLISCQYYPPQVGGISRIMEKLAEALGRERFCCLTGVDAGAAPAGSSGGPRVYRSPAAFFGASRPIRLAAWGRVLSSIMIRERPRAALLATVDDGPYGLRLRRWFALPYVIYAHGNEILGTLAAERTTEEKSRTERVLRGASRVVAVSRFTAGLVERAGVDADRITVVNPGCDVGRFSPRHSDEQLRRRELGDRYADRVIISIGNLVDRKGYDMVIRALARLRAAVPDVTYLIVGDGPFRRGLESLASSAGVRDRVIFAGRRSDAELPALYSLGDVFVMASRERREESDVEGFGIVFLEASACGKPVIGGRSGGVPEAVVDGVTGLLVDPSDPNDIANALARVLTDRNLACRLGSQGRARVVRDFTWAQAADRMESVMTAAAGADR